MIAALRLGGLYRHYSGKHYRLLHVARNATNEAGLEHMVVYQALYHDSVLGNRAIWVRSLAEFTSPVEINGKMRARFAYVYESKMMSML